MKGHLNCLKHFSCLVFGESAQDEELDWDVEDTENETKSCNECVVKEMEIVNLKETNARQQKNDWYENEMEKQKQTFLKQLLDQEDEIKRLKQVNESLKSNTLDFARTKSSVQDEMRFQPTINTSVVAQAITSIVREYIFVYIWHDVPSKLFSRGFFSFI